MDQLSSALGKPPRAGLLPAFPFGWVGSGLALPDAILESYLANLVNSLRDDGFSHVFALTPAGIALNLGSNRIALHQRTPAGKSDVFFLPPDTARGKVVIIPIGHTEQHGYHLPMSTDTLIIDAIGRGVEQSAPQRAVTIPVMPYGVSTHRASFAGTLNADGRAFEDFWVAVIDVLAARGFDRFYLLSGHGGNCSFLVNAVKYAGERHRRIFCATAWLYLSSPEGVAAIEKYRKSAIGGMGHAGELETSFILHLRPDLVHMERVVDETDFVATPSYYMDWVEGGALVANPPWDDDTATGAYGAGSLADAQNGQRWLEAAISEKVTHVEEIHEQHERREARRRSGFGLWGK
jgi:creatinine amidohydrolase